MAAGVGFVSLQYGSTTSPTDSAQPRTQVAAPTPTTARKTGRVPCWIRAPGDDEIVRRVADANPAPVDDTSQVSVLQEQVSGEKVAVHPDKRSRTTPAPSLLGYGLSSQVDQSQGVRSRPGGLNG